MRTQTMVVRGAWVLAGMAPMSSVGARAAPSATPIVVDATATHQAMFGFGATTISLAFGDTDNVPAALRAEAIAALYRDVHLTTGNLGVEPSEADPSNVYAPKNDNADPAVTDPNGFNWVQSRNMHELVVAPGAAYGFDDWFLGPVISTTYALAWVNGLRASDYQRYLDEQAEHVVAVASHWRDTYGLDQPLLMPWNEPTSGNHELVGGSAQNLVDIVKRAGQRLRAAGFATVRFVVPCEETETISLDHARQILEDVDARPFVGAIAYHPYPYGSTYASVPNILATSGAGAPDAGKVALRAQLRDLGANYGVPVWMVEVSHSDLPFDDFDNVRGRAIHIHDELVYADAAAFFGMNAMWDTVTHAGHYAGRDDPGFWSETDTVVLIDVENQKVVISPMGRAIGHYARWVAKGDLRVDATSGDPLVLVTAFVDPARTRLTVVAINNAATDRPLDLSAPSVTLAGSVTGELSTAAAPWVPVGGVSAVAGHILYTLPTHAVVTLVAALEPPVVEPVAETSPEPVVETAPEPVVETAPEPVVETAPEPEPEPVLETVPEPVTEPEPEPVLETEPVTEPEPVVESTAEPSPVTDGRSNDGCAGGAAAPGALAGLLAALARVRPSRPRGTSRRGGASRSAAR